MNRRSPIGRAELLTAYLKTGSRPGMSVELLGFERIEEDFDQDESTGASAEPFHGEEQGDFREESEEVGVSIERKDQEKLTFLAPLVRISVDEPKRKSVEISDPVSDSELAQPERPPLSGAMLTPWSKLGAFFRNRIGRTLPGKALDLPKLSRSIASGVPIKQLPHRSRPSWGNQAVILWDRSPEMEPYQGDVIVAVRRLKRERGRHGLVVHRTFGPPSGLTWLRPKIPILAVSAMGQLRESSAISEEWKRLGRHLARAGHPLTALVPCPKARWRGGVTQVWPSAVWDRFIRFPRHLSPGSGTGLRSVVGEQKVGSSGDGTETLLDLLSTAPLVTPGLLRDVRLLLSREANVGTEHSAWFHSDISGAEPIRYISFREGDSLEVRQQRRNTMALENPTAGLVRQADQLILRHLSVFCSSVLVWETEFRTAFSGPDASLDEKKISDFLTRIMDRLREQAESGNESESERVGLATWFVNMVKRLPPSLRSRDEVARLLGEGLAYALAARPQVEAEIPCGIDEVSFEKAQQGIRTPRGRSIRTRVFWQNDAVVMASADHDVSTDTGSIQLASMVVSPPLLYVRQLGFPSRAFAVTEVGPTGFRIGMPRPNSFTLSSPREKVHFGPVERPNWADRMAYEKGGITASCDVGQESIDMTWVAGAREYGFDQSVLLEGGAEMLLEDGSRLKLEGVEKRGIEWGWVPKSMPAWAKVCWVDQFGLAAEFRVGEVSFVLRWIPPGRFLMGSPGDEPGRWDPEGPRHEVAISRGFWLGETPVTQAQWKAVHDAGSRRRNHTKGGGPMPSHFQGPDELPVESVSWHDSRDFCQRLDEVLPDGPGFRLPWEAEWEYACRAGTESAIYTGDLTIRGDFEAPELEEIVWYGGNCGKELELENPQDLKEFSPAHPQNSGGTHRVKLKSPNPWGLYDMLGNVWEWCGDAWESDAYAERKDGVIDPRHQSEAKDALREVRGGSWGDLARGCRAACRGRSIPGERWDNLGLRLAAGQEFESGAAERRSLAGARSGESQRSPRSGSNFPRIFPFG